MGQTSGAPRDIPAYWRVIDCSFGVFGIIPLYMCRKLIKQMEVLPRSYSLKSR